MGQGPMGFLSILKYPGGRNGLQRLVRTGSRVYGPILEQQG